MDAAANEKNTRWLVDATGADPGTIADFLAGTRWPKLGTQGKIERALQWPPGVIRQIGNGADPDGVGARAQSETEPLPEGTRQTGDPADDLVEFNVRGSFGVRAVVRGPIRDIDALPEAISNFIANMPNSEAETGD